MTDENRAIGNQTLVVGGVYSDPMGSGQEVQADFVLTGLAKCFSFVCRFTGRLRHLSFGVSPNRCPGSRLFPSVCRRFKNVRDNFFVKEKILPVTIPECYVVLKLDAHPLLPGKVVTEDALDDLA